MEETRTTGPGEGGVHAHIEFQPSKGEGMSGKFDPGVAAGGETDAGTGGTMDTARQRAGEMADQARDQLGNAAAQARNRMGDVRDRAEEMMGQARDRADDLLEQAENSEPVRMARENPLPALGLAFAAGFLLAGSSDSGGRFGKTKQQIRGAVMGGISAALAQEVRGMVGMQGGKGGLFDSFMGGQGGGQGSQGAGTAL